MRTALTTRDHAKRSADCGQSSGFTLLEFIVVMILTSIVGYISLLQLASLDAPFDRMQARTQLLQDLKLAQADAVTRGCRGIFKIASDGKSYRYGCDFLAYDATVPPSSDMTLFNRSLPTGIIVSASAPIIFNSRGQAVDAWDDITNVTIALIDNSTGSSLSYASGTLLGTGAFEFNA